MSLASSAAIAWGVPAAAAAASTAAPASAQSPDKASIRLSGSVLDARGERMSGQRLVAPSYAPPVAGAVVAVNGRPIARTGAAGTFSFAYRDQGARRVTVTVSAPGYGTYRLTGVTPSQDGDTLTVQLTGAAQNVTPRTSPRTAPAVRLRGSAALGDTRPGRPDVRDSSSDSGSCAGYSSDSTPPSSISVLEYSEHTASGAPVAGTESGVLDVPFETYVEDVLPNEWVPTWQPASLEAGAMAVKTYAWYLTENWRGGSYEGTCYDADDSINYQRYVPDSDLSATDDAVADTWDTVMTEGGSIFDAEFQATLTDHSSESCGAGLTNYPNTLSQWGSQSCALDGDSWQTVLGIYYPGVAFSDSSASSD